MKILVACEESQAVTIQLRNLGHEAYSCDIQDCSGGFPEWHIKGDCIPLLSKSWDMIIAHPPCTYLTVTGNRWFDIEKYGDKAVHRIIERDKAVSFFMEFVNADCPRVAIENPVGYMNSFYRKPDQIISPYMFGDPYEKRTCLWLKNLPNLIPTEIVNPPERKFFKSGKSMPIWYADSFNLPADQRSKLRSKTFPGIASAMAFQWTIACEFLGY